MKNNLVYLLFFVVLSVGFGEYIMNQHWDFVLAILFGYSLSSLIDAYKKLYPE